MKEVLNILLGWTLTTATAWALGVSLLRRLRVRLYAPEEALLGFIAGSACLSALCFAMCALRVVHKGVFLALAAGSFLLAWRSPARLEPETRLASVPRVWKAIFAVVFAAFAFLYFFNALAPENSPDGAGYHIPILARYYRAHGFERITWNMYANLSQGVEMLFLMAFSFGRHSATALTHLSFLLTLPWLVLTYGRRSGFPSPAAGAALIVFASPVIGKDGSCAYIDVALTAVVFGLYYFLQLWDLQRDSRILIPIGLLAGFAFAVKYNAIVAVPYAVGFVIWKSRRRRMPALRPAFVVASLAILMMVPWLAKNWVFAHDPVAPFFNSIFPNPYFHVSSEADYRNYLKMYSLTSYRQVPLELTVRGDQLDGIYGPLFLLAPLGLFALRKPAGRQLWLPAAVFASTYFANIGARLLMPAVPFAALAMALTFESIPGLLPALVLAHAVASWPAVMKTYCAQYAWRLDEIPIAAALRRPPEDIYLSQTWPPYLVDRMLDRYVPPGAAVFSFSAIPESYTSRKLLVMYEAASNEVLGDILQTPVVRGSQPNHTAEFRFPRRELRRVRLVLDAVNGTDQWNVSEFRIFDGERELPRDARWRLRAWPNPWDVQLAFDNSPVTRWRSWQAGSRGMYIEADFGAPLAMDRVRIDTSDDERVRMHLEEGSPVAGQLAWTTRTPTVNLRKLATGELKLRGVRYLLIDPSNYAANDFFEYPAYWGLKEIARSGATRLYYIQ